MAIPKRIRLSNFTGNYVSVYRIFLVLWLKRFFFFILSLVDWLVSVHSHYLFVAQVKFFLWMCFRFLCCLDYHSFAVTVQERSFRFMRRNGLQSFNCRLNDTTTVSDWATIQIVGQVKSSFNCLKDRNLCFVLNWFSNRTGTSDGRECAQNSLDAVLIWPYLGICTALAVVKWSSRSLVKSPYSLNPENLDWSSTLKLFPSFISMLVLGFPCVALVS